MLINKKRVNSIDFLDKLDYKNLKIGIQITNKEYEKLGLEKFEEGILIEPSYNMGLNCYRNTNGYSYSDKTKDKEYRVVNTIEWNLKDWGGYEHSGITDISRWVYPKIYIEAANIELFLTENSKGNKFIIANIDLYSKKEYIKQTINMFLEIFGFCEIFTKDLELVDMKNKIKRCNWELLPAGIKAAIINKKNEEHKKTRKNDYYQYRLEMLESFDPEETYEGTNGFDGYYAYIFNNTCYLENAFYGNATYVIPKSNWKELSKLSKQEILNTNCVIEKINHTEEWETKIKNSMLKNEKIN